MGRQRPEHQLSAPPPTAGAPVPLTVTSDDDAQLAATGLKRIWCPFCLTDRPFLPHPIGRYRIHGCLVCGRLQDIQPDLPLRVPVRKAPGAKGARPAGLRRL